MARIRLVDVKKDFGGVPALRGIDLTVEHGELLAVLGPSGCGKSTTMQLLAGFLAPDSGEVWADDRLLSSPRGVVPPERRRMSLVFQSYAVWPHMTVFENIAFGLQMRKLAEGQIRERVQRMLDVVNLGGFERRYPHELSGGQQQRVALARALVVEPETLLLDEPLSNLDANLREQMRFEIRRIHERIKVATIYVTHDQAEAMVIADRIAVMNKGVIEQIGTPHEMYEHPHSRFVASFMGGANCLRANVLEPGLVRCGEARVRAAESEGFRPGDEVVLCIRPHAVRVHRLGNGIERGENRLSGRLLQQVYLGDFQDLRIGLGGGTQVRALTPAGPAFEGGEAVVVELPQQACHLLPS
jgi:iron(III) transport system ATP-binding protein